MKHLYLLCLLVLPLCLDAMPWRGYLVSKNGIPLTGYISQISHKAKTSTVVFINDFGNRYEFPAELIKGFAYRDGERTIAFESKRVGGRWRFLQIVQKNAPLELHLLTKGTAFTTLEAWEDAMAGNGLPVIAYWLKPRGRRAVKIGRWGFRRKMRRLLQDRAPELAEKVGEKGYRFHDVPAIVEEYNRKMSPKHKEI